ncbi:unnamed protein product [Oikopleura dioica]|uniref:NIF3-like protein 1 n=1 Tax=Oikopleura dioica TaxID=34765 RepID=E4XBT5_OIKDI|nr:unnamed protein product [Oikopleura dioica]
MKLRAFCDVLEKLAPTRYAAKWDNVGLLLEPADCFVERVLLTNDLTSRVMKEAVDFKANIIISYHPPLFREFKRISQDNWKDRIVTECLKHNIAIYSPHTAHDAWAEGVNAWLIEGIIGHSNHSPISPTIDSRETYEISGKVAESVNRKSFRKHFNKTKISDSGDISGRIFKRDLPKLSEKYLSEIENFQLLCLGSLPVVGTGMGRKGELAEQMKLNDIVDITKKHLKLANLRLVTANDKTSEDMVSTVAVCAGSGASVLSHAGKVDLWITGEMGHHEALDAHENNTSVILAEHSNTERGFLESFKAKLMDNEQIKKRDIQFVVSDVDSDPIKVV